MSNKESGEVSMQARYQPSFQRDIERLIFLIAERNSEISGGCESEIVTFLELEARRNSNHLGLERERINMYRLAKKFMII